MRLALTFMIKHAQREEDALRLHRDWIQGDQFVFVQSKRGTQVWLPMTALSRAAVDRAPRAPVRSAAGYLVISETTKNRYDPNPELSNGRFDELRCSVGLR